MLAAAHKTLERAPLADVLQPIYAGFSALRETAQRVSASIKGGPNRRRGLRCQAVKVQCRQQADDAARDASAHLGEAVVFCRLAIARGFERRRHGLILPRARAIVEGGHSQGSRGTSEPLPLRRYFS